MGAESVYHLFIIHCRACAVCSHAGGEWASDADLCATGNLLRRDWQRAEEIEAKRARPTAGEE